MRLRCPKCNATVATASDTETCSCGARLRVPSTSAPRPGRRSQSGWRIPAVATCVVALLGVGAVVANRQGGDEAATPATTTTATSAPSQPTQDQLAAADKRLESMPPGAFPDDVWIPPSDSEPLSGQAIPGMVIGLRTANATDDEIRTAATSADATVIGQDAGTSLLQFWAPRGAERALETLSTTGVVEALSLDTVVVPTAESAARFSVALSPSKSQSKDTWIQDLTRFSGIDNTSRDVDGLELAVLDGGWVHQGYEGLPLVKQVGTRGAPSGSYEDYDHHPTTVARLACGNRVRKVNAARKTLADADTGMANNCQIRSLDGNGRGSTSEIIAELGAASREARVVNISLGFNEPPDDWPKARECDYIHDHNGLFGPLLHPALRGSVGRLPSLFVFSAGNLGCDELDNVKTAVAGLPNVLIVGAIDQNTEMSGFSSYGPQVDLAAPGGTNWKTNGIFHDEGQTWPIPQVVECDVKCRVSMSERSFGGTSFAAPLVSAAAMILAAADKNAQASDLKRYILESAETRHSTGRHNTDTGDTEAQRIPLLDAKEALELVSRDQSGLAASPQPPTTEAPVQTTTTAPPATTTPDYVDPEEFLEAFLAAWWSGDAPAMDRYATPEVIANFTPERSWASHYRLDWQDSECYGGSSGTGSCSVTVFAPNGSGVSFDLIYEEGGPEGLLIYEITNLGGGV